MRTILFSSQGRTSVMGIFKNTYFFTRFLHSADCMPGDSYLRKSKHEGRAVQCRADSVNCIIFVEMKYTLIRFKMPKDYQTIVDEIMKHLEGSGKKYYSDFYIGITNDVDRRLFDEHNVSRDYSWWIYRTAKDSVTAREVEKHFLELGMRGGESGGNDTSNIVYCYAVTSTTVE